MAVLCWCWILTTVLVLTSASQVFVTLPVDTVDSQGNLRDQASLGAQLDKLKSINVDGFQCEVWWGATEPTPRTYKFDAYQTLVQMAKDRGMQVHVQAAFHTCSGVANNLKCDHPLPSFVSEVPDIWYKDQAGNENREYISLWADSITIADERTPLEMYRDWLAAFASAFPLDLGRTISQVQIGLGPYGELRYPSRQAPFWTSPCGIGAFQAFDKHALADLAMAAKSSRNASWVSPPRDAGDYNSRPDETDFFSKGYSTDYGKFFLNWYSSALKQHGAKIQLLARLILGKNVDLAMKISGNYMWYKSASHASEATAGYYNVNSQDAYLGIAQEVCANPHILKKGPPSNIEFSCLEMADSEQPQDCAAGPEELVRQVLDASKVVGGKLFGTNTGERYDGPAYGKITSYGKMLHAFHYRRLNDILLSGDNFLRFKDFVTAMHAVAPKTEVLV